MSEEILVVGAGPVGLVMAAELARHGVRARIVDKADGPSPFCRAIGVTPRSLEVLDDMGIARELIDAGLWLDGTRVLLAGQPPRDALNDYDDLPFAQLGVPQYATETVLARHLATYGITPERGVALAGLTQDGDGITVELDTPAGRESARFRYVIGCDGAHSTVRKALGIEFEGEGWPFDFMIGDMHVDWEVPRGLAVRAIKPIEGNAPDFLVAIPLPERGRYRLSTIAPERLTRAQPSGDDVQHGIQSDRPSGTLADFQEVADRLLADRAVLTDMRWSSVFRISLRLAQKYRVGNAFIAGDACHIHPPTGGQGMNTGIQDAYNLAWKLALVAQGRANPALLDSYEGERRPVALGVLERTYEATINFGRETRKPDRLEDTQLLVSYAEGPLAVGPGTGRIAPGERIPDVHGLRRHGFGFPLRLFDVLRGPRHVLLVPLADGDTWKVEACAAGVRKSFGDLIRVVAIAPGDAKVEEPPGVELIYDAGGAFAAAFGAEPGDAFLVRPDNYLGRHLRPWAECGVVGYLRDTLGLTPAA